MERSSASPHKSAAAALPWAIPDSPSAPQGLRPIGLRALRSGRVGPDHFTSAAVKRCDFLFTRRESNPQALHGEAGHKIRQTGKGKRLPLPASAPSLRFLSKSLITGTFLNAHFVSSLKVYYSPTAASPSAPHGQTSRLGAGQVISSHQIRWSSLIKRLIAFIRTKSMSVTYLTRKLIFPGDRSPSIALPYGGVTTGLLGAAWGRHSFP